MSTISYVERSSDGCYVHNGCPVSCEELLAHFGYYFAAREAEQMMYAAHKMVYGEHAVLNRDELRIAVCAFLSEKHIPTYVFQAYIRCRTG